MLKTQGYYAEMSDGIAHVMITRHNIESINDEESVKKVLKKELKWIGPHPDGRYPGYDGWYIRTIGSKQYMKILLGKPNI